MLEIGILRCMFWGCGFCSNYLLRKLFAALEDEMLDGVGGTAVVVGGGS